MIRFLKRLSLFILLIVVLAFVCAAVWFRWRTRASLPILDGTVPIPGLSAPVEVLRDAHGVPHIRAQSIADALFAQGYVTAQDRLWQMDLSRRNAEGELSEVFGDRTLRMDIESHTLGLPQVAEKALADLSPEERRLLDSYTRGVNAFIETHRDHLPVEFLLLHYQPEPWREIDSVAVALNLATSLSQTWGSDLVREHIATKLDKELFADVFPDQSALDVPVADVDAAAHPSPKTVRTSVISQKLQDSDFPKAFVTGDGELSAGLGSNNWVVNGSQTKSGRPLLANDPHLAHSVPSVWYMVHLKAPGLNVAGVSLPGLPLVILGHNEHIG